MKRRYERAIGAEPRRSTAAARLTEKGCKPMAWRYQPVFTEHDGQPFFSVCELYFNDAGKLERWTHCPAVTPNGDSIEELTAKVILMMTDVLSWKPVQFSDLRPGMALERVLSMDDRRKLADAIEHSADAFRRVPPPADHSSAAPERR